LYYTLAKRIISNTIHLFEFAAVILEFKKSHFSQNQVKWICLVLQKSSSILFVMDVPRSLEGLVIWVYRPMRGFDRFVARNMRCSCQDECNIDLHVYNTT